MNDDFILPFISYDTFNYFFSALAQSLAALIALVGVFHIYRYPKLVPVIKQRCQKLINLLIEIDISIKDKTDFEESMFFKCENLLDELNDALGDENIFKIVWGAAFYFDEFQSLLKSNVVQNERLKLDINDKFESIISHSHNLNIEAKQLRNMPLKAKSVILLLLLSFAGSLLVLLFNAFLAFVPNMLFLLITLTVSLSAFSCLKMYFFIRDSL